MAEFHAFLLINQCHRDQMFLECYESMPSFAGLRYHYREQWALMEEVCSFDVEVDLGNVYYRNFDDLQ